jgi:hypothetical protein
MGNFWTGIAVTIFGSIALSFLIGAVLVLLPALTN